MAGEGRILHCPGAVHCFAVPQFTWKMGCLAQPCSAPHRGAFAVLVRGIGSIRARLVGKRRHRGMVEKTRGSSPGERLCPEDSRLRAAPDPQEQGWDCWVGMERRGLY